MQKASDATMLDDPEYNIVQDTLMATSEKGSELTKPDDTEDFVIEATLHEPAPAIEDGEYEEPGLSPFFLGRACLTTSEGASDEAEDLVSADPAPTPEASQDESEGLPSLFPGEVNLAASEDASDEAYHTTAAPYTISSDESADELSPAISDADDTVAGESEDEIDGKSFFFLEGADLTTSDELPGDRKTALCASASEDEIDGWSDDESIDMASESSGFCTDDDSLCEFFCHDRDIRDDDIDKDFDYDTGLVMDNDDYTCVVCDEPLNGIGELHCHMMEEHWVSGGAACPATDCSMRYTERQKWFDHIVNAHEPVAPEPRYRCRFCRKGMPSCDAFKKHVRVSHHRRALQDHRRWSREGPLTRSRDHVSPIVRQPQLPERERQRRHIRSVFPNMEVAKAPSFTSICDCDEFKEYMHRIQVY